MISELTKVAKLLIAKDKNVNFKNKKMKDITGKKYFLTRSNAEFSQVWRVRGKLDVFWMAHEYYGNTVKLKICKWLYMDEYIGSFKLGVCI